MIVTTINNSMSVKPFFSDIRAKEHNLFLVILVSVTTMSYMDENTERGAKLKDSLPAIGTEICDKRIINVVLAMDPHATFVRQILKGIALSSEHYPDWNLTLNQGLSHRLSGPLPWRPDGIIACTWSAAQSQALHATGVPLVDLGRRHPGTEAWSPFTMDENAVGAAGLEHLRERGYKHFGLVTADNDTSGHTRGHGFRKAVAALGVPCHHIDQAFPNNGIDPLLQVTEMAAWLARAPRPLGLLCFNDILATTVVTACLRIGAAVPDEIGILGCDDDELFCSLGNPPRSSLVLPHTAMGQRAGELMASLLRGEPRPPAEVFGPGEVTVRRSTDRRVSADPLIGHACEWIGQHVGHAIGVIDVAKAVGLSRRSLERRMRDVLGCTVLEVIHRARLARAKELLQGPHSVAQVAEAVGLTPAGFHDAFVRQLGITPGEWRRSMAE